jgi:hypothetical protein
VCRKKVNLKEPLTQMFMEEADILFPVICKVLEFVYYKSGFISIRKIYLLKV